MFTTLLLSLLLPSAQAASDIEFKTAGPVIITVDGEQAVLTSKLKQRAGGLEPGAHIVKVAGVFGKTLYEAEIDLPDGTITQAEWSGRELKVLSTDWLDDDQPAEEVVVNEEAAPEPEPVIAEADPDEQPVVEPEAVEEVPLALPFEDHATALAPLPPQAQGRTLTVQAQEGMRVEIVFEGQRMYVVVEDGGFSIEDPQGLKLALSGGS